MTKNLILILAFFISCGKSPKEKTSVSPPEEEEAIDGLFMAQLLPVNPKISSQVIGNVKISKYGDDFKVDVKLTNAPPGKFRQHLHTGFRCPNLDADSNRDGVVDSYESKESMGYIIVPFDDDLSMQLGRDFFLTGNYHYSKSTSYYLMLSDLHLSDDISNDSIVKLNEKELPLQRRVVSIFGKIDGLPISMAGAEVPVACGVLSRLADTESPPTDEYEQPTPSRPRTNGTRPRPRPQPRPEPEIEPEPESGGGWWDRLRQRWRRWWDRWRSNDDEQSLNISKL